MEVEQVSRRDYILTIFLCMFGWPLGLHRFYCGKIVTGFIYAVVFFIFKEMLMRAIRSTLLFVCGFFYLKFYAPQLIFQTYGINKLTFENVFAFFRSEHGLFAFYVNIILCIVYVVDLVLIVCKRFRDKEGRVVCYSKFLDKTKRKKV